MAERVGFIGLGIMGSRMAANLRARGARADRVEPHRRDRARVGGRARRGGRRRLRRTWPAQRRRDHDGRRRRRRSNRCCSASDGAAEGARRASCASTCPRSARRAARRVGPRLAEREFGFMDAPVTGSSPKAEDGTLTIMAGGEPRRFARARPLFEAMGELVVHVGALGQGQLVKVINNAVAAANAAVVAEALLAGSRAARPRRARDGDEGGLRRVGDAGAEGGADARPRLGHAVQARAHAEGPAPLPRGGRGGGSQDGARRETAEILAAAERGARRAGLRGAARGRRGALGRAPLAGVSDRAEAGRGRRARRRASGARSTRSRSRTAPTARCPGPRPRART